VAQGVAQDDQGGGLAQAVAGLAVDGQRLVGMFDGLGVVTLGEVGCCQGGVDLTFQDSVAGPAGEGQGLPGVVDALSVMALLLAGGGQPEEGVGFVMASAGLARQVEGLLVLAQLAGHERQVAEACGLTIDPAGLPGQRQRIGEVLGRLGVVARARDEHAEVAVGGGLGAGFTRGRRGGHAGVGDRGPVPQVAVVPEVAAKGVGQQPRRRPWPVVGGLLDGGDLLAPQGLRSHWLEPPVASTKVANKRYLRESASINSSASWVTSTAPVEGAPGATTKAAGWRQLLCWAVRMVVRVR
jgi:hypothetical protein